MSKGLATQMLEAFDGHHEMPEVSDEALARMDWAAGLTDVDLEHLKKGLVLLQHAAEAFRARVAESEITRLADELEALP